MKKKIIFINTNLIYIFILSTTLIALFFITILNPFFFFNNQISKVKYNLKTENKTFQPDNNLCLPFDINNYIKITDKYGKRVHPISKKESFHDGIDFGLKHHCPIKAIYDGEVYLSKVYGGYGNCIILKHTINNKEFYSLYAHLSKRYVKKNTKVNKGEVIALEGGSKTDNNPGTSTGHHLHFEIWNSNKKSINPIDYLKLPQNKL